MNAAGIKSQEQMTATKSLSQRTIWRKLLNIWVENIELRTVGLHVVLVKNRLSVGKVSVECWQSIIGYACQLRGSLWRFIYQPILGWYATQHSVDMLTDSVGLILDWQMPQVHMIGLLINTSIHCIKYTPHSLME